MYLNFAIRVDLYKNIVLVKLWHREGLGRGKTKLCTASITHMLTLNKCDLES